MLAALRASTRIFIHWGSVCAPGECLGISSLEQVRHQSARVFAIAQLDHLSERASCHAAAPYQQMSTSAAAEALSSDPVQLRRIRSNGLPQSGCGGQVKCCQQRQCTCPGQPLAAHMLTRLDSRQALGYSTAAAATEPSEGPSSAPASMLSSARAPGQDSAAEAVSTHISTVSPGRVQNIPPPPWMPTRELKKRNFLPRRMGHLMQVRDTSIIGTGFVMRSDVDCVLDISFLLCHILLRLMSSVNKGCLHASCTGD